ncbi:hypothetical protein ACSBOB_32705 [Mesorhizobium sp. ASY16-5R]|uniref:hypothetical protein n=1 Tax=Mesorhizobium sp. ASY16-5R TaxID=3445772 RepID=UPI003FA1957D
MRRRAGEAVFAFLAASWLGLLLGVSFLATPVKFRALSLDRPIALDVRRVNFAVFSKVELGAAISGSDHHLWYVAGEVTKAVLLPGLAVDALGRVARPAVSERA